MGGYRFYLLTEDYLISSSVDIACANDAEAMVFAGNLLQNSEAFPMVEIWNGPRLVGRCHDWRLGLPEIRQSLGHQSVPASRCLGDEPGSCLYKPIGRLFIPRSSAVTSQISRD